MKFLHLADIHLDSPLKTKAARDPALAQRLRAASRQVLARMTDAAIAERVDAVLFAGDTFDSAVADLASRAVLAREISRLERAGIAAILIQGNHDALLDLDRYGPLASGLTVLTPQVPTVRIGDAAVHGMGFDLPHVAESLLPRYPPPAPGLWNIGLMHTSLDGSAGHDPYAPCGLADLLAHGYDYWALGHIHKRGVYHGERTLAVMAGIPQGRSIRETAGGSATLVTLNGEGVSERQIPLELLRFSTLTIDMSGIDNQAGRADMLNRTLAQRALEGPEADALALSVELRGAPGDLGDPDLLEAQVRAAAEEFDAIFVDRVRAIPRGRGGAGAVLDDLTGLMAEDAARPGFRDEIATRLSRLRLALPAEIRDTLDPEEIDGLIDEGVARMAMKLRDGGE